MTYYITLTANRKDAKRHIFASCNNLRDVLRLIRQFRVLWERDKYTWGVYTGNWQPIDIIVNELEGGAK